MVLSSACALQAQAREVADSTSTASASNKVSSRRQLPEYQMKEVTGVVYDAATRQPASLSPVFAYSHSAINFIRRLPMKKAPTSSVYPNMSPLFSSPPTDTMPFK